METKANYKQSNETTRKAIIKIFNYYKVPSDLRKSFWKAFNAAHTDPEQQELRR